MGAAGAMSGPHLGRWEPLSGVLADYEAYWTPTTDAPRVYHVAAGLVVVAATVENRVYLPFGGEHLYPNLFALLLGPSSFYRKSTCIAKARRTLARLHEGGGNNGPLLPDEFSREAFLKKLSERGQGLLTYSEFSGALATFSRDYMAGTKELLADLYDSPEHYVRMVGSQTWTLRDVCLSILAASQTDWFLEKLKAGDVRGGFLARFSYWPAFEKRRFIAVPPEPDSVTGNRLVTGLNELRNVRGAAVLPPSERDRYSAWLAQHEHDLHRSPKAGELSTFWSRLSIMTLKFAMLIQLAHNRALVISPLALDRAVELTEFLKSALRHLFDEEFAFTRSMQDRQRVLRLVRSRPGIAFRDLLRASSLLKRDLAPVLETLVEEGLVVSDKGRHYWPAEAEAVVVSEPVSEDATDTVRLRISRVK